MSLVNIELKNERQVGLRFEQFPDHLRDDLRAEIDSLTNELRGRVQQAIPSRSGETRSSVNAKLYETKDRVTGRVSVADGNQELHRKAASLEYGSTGKKKPVRRHTMRLGHFWDEKLAAPRTVIVKAFLRKANVKEHRFLRGSLDAMKATILSRLGNVVSTSVNEANS